MDHIPAGLQSAEADKVNRRAWDRETRAFRVRPKGSRDLDDTIRGSVGEMGTAQARDHGHATETADGWRVPLRGKCVRARTVCPPRASKQVLRVTSSTHGDSSTPGEGWEGMPRHELLVCLTLRGPFGKRGNSKSACPLLHFVL